MHRTGAPILGRNLFSPVSTCHTTTTDSSPAETRWSPSEANATSATACECQ